jgi:hypothetical protein
VLRSSSISSASSVSAPSTKLDVQARCRYAKLCSERLSVKPTIASVPEDHEAVYLTSSPESYAVFTGKPLCDMSDVAALPREREMTDAARALQELQRYGANRPTKPVRAGSKRSRGLSIEHALHDDVREMLAGGEYPTNDSWSATMVRVSGQASQGVALKESSRHKRVCCATEAALALPLRMSSLHPAVGGYGGPGMWEGILN